MISIVHPSLEEIVETHYTAIRDYINNRGQKKIPEIENLLSRYFVRISFESLIKASPKELAKLCKAWDETTKSADVMAQFKIFKTYYSYLNRNPSDDSRKGIKFETVEKKKYTAAYLIDRLGIHVCPYCNRNFINDGGRFRSSEIDHFYPKSKYPFLAISFFNLIPCCKVCNKFKGEKIIAFNPYDSKEVFDSLKFKVQINSTSFYYLTSGLDLSLVLERADSSEIDSFNDQIKDLKLDKLYKHHKDVVLEHIQKGVVYSDSYIDELYKNFEGTLFKNREDVLRILYGNFVDEEDYSKRPLSKLTHDVAKQFEVK